MPILKGLISKINGSAGSLTCKQTGGQTIVSEIHTPSALHPVVHEGSRCFSVSESYSDFGAVLIECHAIIGAALVEVAQAQIERKATLDVVIDAYERSDICATACACTRGKSISCTHVDEW